jgi:ubiquinone/menaquinone biosynthesis C-methylase UbiE
MKHKNISRCDMLWELGDMTNMTNYSNNSFDIVFDKGALDALCSTNTVEIQSSVKQMFKEINRVLVQSGSYICVSLAEEFVFDSLLSFFCCNDVNNDVSNYDTIIERLMSEKPSPFIPFLITMTKVNTINSSIESNINTVKNLSSSKVDAFFDTFGEECDIADKLSVVEVKEKVHFFWCNVYVCCFK